MNDISLKKSCDYKWYVVYTRSRTEKKAFRELTKKGIECYLPIISIRKRWGKQSRVVEEPLIRGYVFVRVSRKEFYEVLITSGVLWYVCFDNKPAVIEDNQIESLRRFVENGQSDIQVTSEEIRMGDLVRIIDGALKNLYAEVVHIRGKSRLLLRFTNLGCCVHVEIGAHKVSLLHPQQAGTIKIHPSSVA